MDDFLSKNVQGILRCIEAGGKYHLNNERYVIIPWGKLNFRDPSPESYRAVYIPAGKPELLRCITEYEHRRYEFGVETFEVNFLRAGYQYFKGEYIKMKIFDNVESETLLSMGDRLLEITVQHFNPYSFDVLNEMIPDVTLNRAAAVIPCYCINSVRDKTCILLLTTSKVLAEKFYKLRKLNKEFEIQELRVLFTGSKFCYLSRVPEQRLIRRYEVDNLVDHPTNLALFLETQFNYY